MALSSVTLNTTQSQSDYSGINDLVNQLINALTTALTNGGISYTVIYDNNAGLSTTVQRLWVVQIANCPHYIQIQSNSHTNVVLGTLKLANSIPDGTFTMSVGNFATYYFNTTLQNRIVSFLGSSSTIVMKSDAPGVNPAFLLCMMKCNDGQFRCVCVTNAILSNNDDSAFTLATPSYGAAVDGSGNNLMIPALAYLNGAIAPWQPTNIFGVTLNNQYSMFQDANGVYYYYGNSFLISE